MIWKQSKTNLKPKPHLGSPWQSGIITALLCLSLTVALGACSSKSTDPTGGTGPGPGPAGATFLADKTSAALVPGGTVVIGIKNSEGSTVRQVPGREYVGSYASACDASTSDPGVATVACNGLGTAFTIDAIGIGSATVTVSDGAGQSIVVPVQVYDPRVLETDELYITFVDSFQVTFTPFGICGLAQLDTFYDPVPPDGYHMLGSQFMNGQGALPSFGGFAVKAKPGSDALAPPDSARFIWHANTSNSCIIPPVLLWDPVPPPGYVSMGSMVDSVVWPATNGPTEVLARRSVVPMCIRQDLVEAGSPAAEPYWCDCGSGHPVDAAAWSIQEGLVGDVMPMGTIVAKVGWSAPTFHPVMNVLKIDLPVVAEGPGQSFVPALSSLDQPPAETPPLRAWQMLIPYTMVDDEILTPQQSAEQSPLYLLERQVFYKLIDHFHNTTAINQDSPPLEITSGVETTESETFWNSTGISITASAGIELKGFSASVSTTVTQEFGYSSQSTVTELEKRSRTVTMTTRPNHATAIWQKMTRFVLYRHDGTDVEPVATWDLGEDSHVLDEYPDS